MSDYDEDTTDVAVLVIRHRESDGDYYLLVRNWEEVFWEFLGGKRKKGEPFEHASKRELKDEIEYDWNLDEVDVREVGEPYESPRNEVFDLYPVLVKISGETAMEIRPEHLNEEHDDIAWVQVDQLDDNEILEQEKAPERLGIK